VSRKTGELHTVYNGLHPAYLPAFMAVVLPVVIVASFKHISRVGSVVYRFINDWVPGRTVGTLGIIIAGLGVLGEAYQFTTQLVI